MLPDRLRSPSVVCALSVALLIAASVVSAGGLMRPGFDVSRPDRTPPLGSVSTQQDAARELAERYAPIVYIKDQREPCDRRGSPFAPVPVDFLLDVDGIRLMEHSDGRTSEVQPTLTAADLYGKDDSYFIDMPGNPKRPGCGYERDYLTRADGYTPTAYAHIAYEEGHEGFALQYWLFYYFNDWNNKHEGDWEMIQIVFNAPSPLDALAGEPNAAGYSQHGGGERSDWDDSKLTREGTRPVAFVAAGANANQFEPNIILGRGEAGTGFGCDDATKPSTRVPLEAVLVEEPADASSEFAWLNFDGRWGERAPWEFNGPTGPNDKRAWTQPFAWQEDLRPSSIIVPTGTVVGPNAVNLFCEAVWYMSTPMFLVFRLPPMAWLGVAIASLGACVYVATRTRYWPIVAEPLRGRRQLGQLFTSAAGIYRRGLSVFLAIGLLFIPAGLIGSALSWLVGVTPVPGTIAGYFEENLLVSLILALAVGNLATSLVYWFVTIVTLAAVARLESGRTYAPHDDLRDALRQFAALLVPRLKALAIIMLLTLSIIGIPWAIRQGVRWAFIEEAVLLDGKPSREAMSSSSRAVDGHWWRAAWVLWLLAFSGYFSGAFIAVGLLLLTSFSVSLVNLMSSLVFVAVTPFIAITQSLLYFDLTTASDEAADAG